MPLDVIMPALGMAQDTGRIVAWHKASGDAVAAGDVLFEVETDKATMEVEAQEPGYLTDVAAAAAAMMSRSEMSSPGSRTPPATAPPLPCAVRQRVTPGGCPARGQQRHHADTGHGARHRATGGMAQDPGRGRGSG